MTENDKLQMFEDQTIRTAWDEEKEEWYFSVVDVVVALTESPDYKTGRKYWNKLKQRLKEEGRTGDKLSPVERKPPMASAALRM